MTPDYVPGASVGTSETSRCSFCQQTADSGGKNATICVDCFAATRDGEALARAVQLAAAAASLVAKLDLISENKEFQGVFQMSWAHGHNYAGPTWADELADLRGLLGDRPTPLDTRICKMCGSRLACPSCQPARELAREEGLQCDNQSEPAPGGMRKT